MTALEIILLLLGIAFIVISCFIIDRNPSGEKTDAQGADAEGLARIGEDIKQDLNGEAGRIIADAQDKLESLSNDKIIAVGEYSDQVIEKIEADHKEVVFLYQMLCDKEEELKEMTNRMNSLKTECERVIMEEQEEADKRASLEEEMEKLKEKLEEEKERSRRELELERERIREETEKERDRAEAEKELNEQLAAPHVKPDKNEGEKPEEAAPEVKKAASKTKNQKKTAADKSTRQQSKARPQSTGWESVKATDARDTRMLSRNDEIIALYKQNKSVLEISKLLQMGQGEVKLIIDLYCR